MPIDECLNLLLVFSCDFFESIFVISYLVELSMFVSQQNGIAGDCYFGYFQLYLHIVISTLKSYFIIVMSCCCLHFSATIYHIQLFTCFVERIYLKHDTHHAIWNSYSLIYFAIFSSSDVIFVCF